jgi:hypothetical protein
MNQLSPELKKLLSWAKQAPREGPNDAPAGFATRVVAHWNSSPAFSLLGVWQKAIWRSAWAAAAVIILGLALITAQKRQASSGYDLSPAYQLVSTELIP